MAWTITVNLDEDKTDVGSATAVFTDTDSTEYSYSDRVKMTAAGRDEFLNNAIAQRNAWQTRKSKEASYKANAETRMTQLDV